MGQLHQLRSAAGPRRGQERQPDRPRGREGWQLGRAAPGWFRSARRRRPRAGGSSHLGNETIDGLDERDRLLSRGLLEFFRDCWLGGTGIEFTDPRVSLRHADLGGLPPTSPYCGTEEILAGEDAEFGELLLEAGVDAEVHAVEDAQHSFVIAAGNVPAVDRAISEMGGWLKARLGVASRS